MPRPRAKNPKPAAPSAYLAAIYAHAATQGGQLTLGENTRHTGLRFRRTHKFGLPGFMLYESNYKTRRLFRFYVLESATPGWFYHGLHTVVAGIPEGGELSFWHGPPYKSMPRPLPEVLNTWPRHHRWPTCRQALAHFHQLGQAAPATSRAVPT